MTKEQLLSAIKQLSHADLREFTREFLVWYEQNEIQFSSKEIQRSRAEEEAALLASISENSRLPSSQQRRYDLLRRKCEDRILTECELAEYQSLLQQLEARNVKRIEALITLAQLRGTTLRSIMAELGLKGV